MQQHAGPSGAQHDDHLTGGSVDRLKVNQGLTRRLFGVLPPALVFQEKAPFDPPAAAEAAGLTIAAVFGYNRDVEAA